jgi:hypothetical protein
MEEESATPELGSIKEEHFGEGTREEGTKIEILYDV